MQKIKWLLPLIAFFPLLMAPTGGFPSLPSFLGIGVGRSAPSGSVAIQATTSGANTFYQLADTTTGGGVICISDTAGACVASGASHDIIVTSNAGIELVPSTGLVVGNPTGGLKGAGTINVASGVYSGNIAVPATSVLSLASTTASAACTLNGSVSRNIASCTTNAGGNLTTVTFTTAMASAPACVISQNSGLAANVAAVISAAPLPTTTGFTVSQSASPGPGYMIICTT
jgi:hypothetical protein